MILAPSGVASLALAFLCTLPLSAQVNVLTYQYDNTRAGLNSNETVLTPASVNQNQFGKLFSYPVDGYVYAQPLYLSNVAIPGKATHNVVFVATEHDSVYAFDADSNAGPNAAPLWQVNFLDSSRGVTTVPASDLGCGQIVPEIGITGTPVIDPASGTLYLVAMTKESTGSAVSYVHRLHALDVTSGAERPGSPVVIQPSSPGTGDGGSTAVFIPKNYKQRPGLLLLNGIVYTAWSSHCDIGRYHGWLVGHDAQTLEQLTVYNSTPNGGQGSFWASGAAPAADAAGNIYVVSGNGTFDFARGGPDLGDSYIKLSSGSPPAVLDYFTPFNVTALNDGDVDVGSSGVALLPDEAGSASHPHLMVGAGKEGRIYLLDRDNMGKWQAGSDSQIVFSMAKAIGPLFGNPAYFNKNVYFCGSGDSLKAIALSNGTFVMPPGSKSQAEFDYPGCVPTVSASGTSNGIVWLLEASGTLRAYDASNLATELYDSNQNSARDALGSYVKFTAPTVANGKVYAGTQNSLAVYGLLAASGASLTVANAASGQRGIAAPGSIISIAGSGLAQSTSSATSYPLLTTLADVSVGINGIAAPLYFASPGQLNVQVPFEVSAGSVTVTVTSAGKVVGSAALTIASVAPGLFTIEAGHAAVVNQDGTINSATQPAGAATIIAAYLTGFGAVDNPVATGAAAPADPLSRVMNVTATIEGQTASVVFAGLAPGFAGLYQVNILVPQLPPGDHPLQVFAGGVPSNIAPVSIR